MQWVSTREKTNHSYVCALRQTALFYLCSSEVRHAYNQQEKEQAECPVGAGVGATATIPGHP